MKQESRAPLVGPAKSSGAFSFADRMLGMELNPYESPHVPTESPTNALLPRIGCLILFAVGGMFVLSIFVDAIFTMLFPAEEPAREPHFAPIPVNERTK